MILQYVLLSIGTLLGLLFLLLLLTASQYRQAVAGLDEKRYPLKELYIVGFRLQDAPLFRLRGQQARKLMTDAQLLYGRQYAEYYARLAWAQALTFFLLVGSFMLAFIAFIEPSQVPLLLFAGALIGGGLVAYALGGLKEQVQQRRDACAGGFADVVTKLALLVNSGMILREAWETTANSGEGELYELMQRSVSYMENGHSPADAIYEFGVLSDTPEIKKITGAIIQAMEKGSADLSYMLIQQSSEQWNHKKQVMLQKGELAAGKLLLPIGLMLVAIMIIIVVPIFVNLVATL